MFDDTFGEIEIIGRAAPRKPSKSPFQDVQPFMPYMEDVKSDDPADSDVIIGDPARLKFWENLPDNYDGEWFDSDGD